MVERREPPSNSVKLYRALEGGEVSWCEEETCCETTVLPDLMSDVKFYAKLARHDLDWPRRCCGGGVWFAGGRCTAGISHERAEGLRRGSTRSAPRASLARMCA